MYHFCHGRKAFTSWSYAISPHGNNIRNLTVGVVTIFTLTMLKRSWVYFMRTHRRHLFWSQANCNSSEQLFYLWELWIMEMLVFSPLHWLIERLEPTFQPNSELQHGPLKLSDTILTFLFLNWKLYILKFPTIHLICNSHIENLEKLHMDKEENMNHDIILIYILKLPVLILLIA